MTVPIPRAMVALAGGLLLLVACSRSGPDVPGRPAAGQPSPLIDPDQIVSGGPPPDGIPPIDHPKFLDPASVDFLAPREPVLAFEVAADARAYPLQIMIWHEIANDTVGGRPVTITYCPLCNTAIAFARPTIRGRLLDFGTSGKLYHSNLLMYDRQTKSLWSQATGQAVVGELTGTQLEFLPIQTVAWADWLARHPDGRVLSRDTGHDRSYGENPYVGYDRPDSQPFLFQEEVDPRLPALARVVGVQVGKDVAAFAYDRLRARAVGGWAAAPATVGGLDLVAFWKEGTVSAVDDREIGQSRDVGATGVFRPVAAGRDLEFTAGPAGITDRQTGSRWDILGRAVEGPLEGVELERAVAIDSFWFDWAAFHPDSRILP